MAVLMFLLFLIAVPVYLIVGALVIGGYAVVSMLPVVIIAYLVLVAIGAAALPVKPFFDRYAARLDHIGQLVGLILFGPLIVLILFAILATPFVMIYALADNPLLWFSVIAGIAVFNIYYHNRSNA